MDVLIEKLKENKKKILIILIIIALLVLGYFIYKYITTYEVDIKLKEERIKVNLYETVDLSKYLVSAKDNKGNDLTKSVEIEIEIDDIDVMNDTTLTICGNGPKAIYYTYEKDDIRVQKVLIIKVITDPNDEDYNPISRNENCAATIGNEGVD